jgi:hypothetical protein
MPSIFATMAQYALPVLFALLVVSALIAWMGIKLYVRGHKCYRVVIWPRFRVERWRNHELRSAGTTLNSTLPGRPASGHSHVCDNCGAAIRSL